MSHRGPDDHGILVEKNVGLGHRRLSIIDLAGGHQPMFTRFGDSCVVYNGEIYNFKELRHQLANRGHLFKTNSDKEVLLNAYAEWGIDCVSEFRGMFACAVWDAKHQQLFIARDRLGIKPLYYFLDQYKLVFASEIKAALGSP